MSQTMVLEAMTGHIFSPFGGSWHSTSAGSSPKALLFEDHYGSVRIRTVRTVCRSLVFATTALSMTQG